MVNGASPGPAPARHACASSSPHPELTDVAPPEAAQEGAQGGWRFDRAAQSAGRPPGAQHIGVVDAVAARQRGGHQGHHLVAGVGPPRRAAQVKVIVYEFPQAQVLGQGGRQEQAGEQAGIGHQPSSKVIWIRSGCVVASNGCSLGLFCCYKTIIPIQRSTLWPLQGANLTPSLGGGFKQAGRSRVDHFCIAPRTCMWERALESRWTRKTGVRSYSQTDLSRSREGVHLACPEGSF